jgi:hypothetical protein
VLAGSWRAPEIVTVGSFSDGGTPTLTGHIHGKHCRFTLDTGATRSIVRPDMIKKKLLQSRLNIILRTATGEPASILGEVDLDITIDDTIFRHRFLVAHIEDDCLIGMDFMKKYGFEMSTPKSTVTIGEREFPLQLKELTSPRTARIFVAKDVNIPGMTECVIAARVSYNGDQEYMGLVEPHPSKELSNNGLLFARSLGKVCKGIIPVRVANLDGNTRRLHRGEEIGTCESVTWIKKLEAAPEERKTTGIPKALQPLLNETTKGLNTQQKASVSQLLAEFQDVFVTKEDECGRTNLVMHRIDTGNARPIRQRPRQLPFGKRSEAEALLEAMKEQEVIEPSTSPWASPVVLVKKKDGTLHFCVDYPKLNKVTKKDSYPLPRIDDTLDTLSGSKWFSTLDLKSGYWQVGLHPEDKEKTALTTGSGL